MNEDCWKAALSTSMSEKSSLAVLVANSASSLRWLAAVETEGSTSERSASRSASLRLRLLRSAMALSIERSRRNHAKILASSSTPIGATIMTSSFA